VSGFESITSPANQRVRRAAALRDAATRRASGLTLVDGRRELARAVAAGVPIEDLFVAAAVSAEDWIATLAATGSSVAVLSERAFERVAFGARNEGVVGVVRFAGGRLADVAFAADRPLLVVEGAEKPGNLGAIVRTADAAGLAGVLVCDGATDLANPAVIRASLGTVFALPTATATTAEAIAHCASTRRRVFAARPDATTSWSQVRLAGRTALLVGSEAHGLSEAWARAAAEGRLALEPVRIPMRGVADSLNLSAAVAVLAYEAVRQQEAGG